MILTGMVLKFIFDLLYPLTPFEMVEVSGIGVVIPGIIANTIQNRCRNHIIINDVINMYYLCHLILI